jgi:hypothetical protein
MTEYDHYLNYTNAMNELRERVEHTQRTRVPGQARRRPGRQALARRLHSIAERLDG